MISKLNALLCRFLLILACAMALYGAYVVALRFTIVVVAFFGYMAWKRFRRQPITDAHGSATAITSPLLLERNGLLADRGLILGRVLPDTPTLPEAARGLFSPVIRSEIACRGFLAAVFSDRWLSEQLIRTTMHLHLLTCSPSGGGKSIATLIPNLLSYRGNCVIVDPKGELYKAVAKHRRKKFGKRIYRLDPFNVAGPGGDTLNPYDFINPKADDFLDQCRDFANAVIIREPSGEKQPHFNDLAEMNLTALTAFICGCEHDRSRRHLGTMRNIASSRSVYDQAVAIMQQTDACQGVISKLGGMIAFPAAEEQLIDSFDVRPPDKLFGFSGRFSQCADIKLRPARTEKRQRRPVPDIAASSADLSKPFATLVDLDRHATHHQREARRIEAPALAAR